MIYLTLNVPHTWFPLKLEELQIWIKEGKKLKTDIKVIDPVSTTFKREIPTGAFNFIGSVNTSHYRMLKEFERKNVKVINKIDTSVKVDDKFYCLSELENVGVAVPKRFDININPGFSVNMQGELSKYINHVIGYPCVLKYPTGGQGEGHIFIKDEMSFNDVYSMLCLTNPRFGFQESGIDFFVEEFIQNKGKFANSIRVNMWDGECINAFSRGTQNNWKANLHWKTELSTCKHHDKVNKHIKQICNTIYETFKLKLMGIDIFESDKGYIVGEVNSSPAIYSSITNLFGNTKFNIFEKIINELI